MLPEGCAPVPCTGGRASLTKGHAYRRSPAEETVSQTRSHAANTGGVVLRCRERGTRTCAVPRAPTPAANLGTTAHRRARAPVRRDFSSNRLLHARRRWAPGPFPGPAPSVTRVSAGRSGIVPPCL